MKIIYVNFFSDESYFLISYKALNKTQHPYLTEYTWIHKYAN